MPSLSGLRIKSGLHRSLNLLYFEGAFAVAFDALVGPVYIAGVAGEVGIPLAFVTVLAAAPWIGQIGQITGSAILSGSRSMKKCTLLLASLSRASWLVPVGLAAFWGLRSYMGGPRFPTLHWFGVAAAVACFAAIFGMSSGVTWNSWVSHIVPEKYRGRFFGVKQRYGMAALVAANFAAVSWIGWKPEGYHLGFLILGLVGLLCAVASTVLLSKIPRDPHEKEPAGKLSLKEITESFKAPFSDRAFTRTLAFGAFFQGSILLAGPYFPYYFTKELHLSVGTVAFWTMLNNLGAFLASSWWGRRIDKHGLEFALLGGGTMMALSPLPYCLSGTAVAVIGPIEYFVNGMSWAGQSLALTALLFRNCPAGQNSAYFSVYMAANGAVGALCVATGGVLADLFVPWGGFKMLWIVSSIARFGVLWILGRAALKEPRESVEILQPA